MTTAQRQRREVFDQGRQDPRWRPWRIRWR
jgi:hypothetical protein